MRSWRVVLFLCACSSSARMTMPGGDLGVAADLSTPVVMNDLAVTPTGDAQPQCETPPMPAGAGVTLGPDFTMNYTAYLLGSVPGVPSPLGGVLLKHDDPNTLLIAGASESSAGAIYAIGVRRDGCNHIIELVGTASKFADAPSVDANLVYGPQHLLVYTEWPEYTLSQLLPGDTFPSRRTDLRPLGVPDVDDSGPGGVGFVPVGNPAAGQLRLVTWPAGRWFHVGVTLEASGLYSIDSVTQTTQLDNNPGGFAYVPAGSPGFTNQSLIVAEWNEVDGSKDRVAVYEVDNSGDPIPATRREFMSEFPRPWGAYFEPLTGDYLFLTWGAGNDRVYIVQGFVPPQPVF